MGIYAGRTIELAPKVGEQKIDLDGVTLTGGASACIETCLYMPEDLHLQGSILCFEGMQLGDYGWVALINPAGNGTLAAQASGTSVTVATGLGAYYDPANGAKYVEIWDSGVVLKEVRKIASVSGDVVTLASALTGTYDVTHTSRVRTDGHSPVRGDYGIDGGLRFLGSGNVVVKNEFAITELLPEGMELCARLITCADAGTRKLAVSYLFRKPKA